MSDITFPSTLLKTDKGEFIVGQVIRRVGSKDQWSDTIILGFSEPNKRDEVYVRVSRPFAYASCVGTTSPSVLLGAETYTITALDLTTGYETTKGYPMIAGSIGHNRAGAYESEVIDQRTKAA